jgi:hypothetical protein
VGNAVFYVSMIQGPFSRRFREKPKNLGKATPQAKRNKRNKRALRAAKKLARSVGAVAKGNVRGERRGDPDEKKVSRRFDAWAPASAASLGRMLPFGSMSGSGSGGGGGG